MCQLVFIHISTVTRQELDVSDLQGFTEREWKILEGQLQILTKVGDQADELAQALYNLAVTAVDNTSEAYTVLLKYGYVDEKFEWNE